MKFSRFSLRDMFWLVLVCALAVGWWADRGAYTTVIHDCIAWRDRYIGLALDVEEERALLEPLGWRFDKEGNYPVPRKPSP